jgi:hypothetical protein
MSNENEIVIIGKENIISTEPLPERFNLDLVRNILHEKENPHPLSITLIVITSLLLLYIIYILFIKTSISGKWYGNINTYSNMIVYQINHNKFNNKLKVRVVKSPDSSFYSYRYSGYLLNKDIYLITEWGDTKIGKLLNHGLIQWSDNDSWSRNKKLI